MRLSNFATRFVPLQLERFFFDTSLPPLESGVLATGRHGWWKQLPALDAASRQRHHGAALHCNSFLRLCASRVFPASVPAFETERHRAAAGGTTVFAQVAQKPGGEERK